MIISINSQDEL